MLGPSEKKEPGDLVLLRYLCQVHKLGDMLAAREKLGGMIKQVGSDCGPGSCDNNCSLVCATCYACIDNCTLGQ